MGQTHYQAGRYAEAVKYSQDAVHQQPDYLGAHRQFCASLAQAGRQGRAALGRLRQVQPEISRAWTAQNLPLTPEPMKHCLDGFSKAGLE